MRGWAFIAALVAGTPSAAFADPGESPLEFALRYDPPAGCPTRSDFEQAIASRAEGTTVAESRDGIIAFDAELATDGASVAAVLVTTLPDGTRSRRDVTAASCSEAVSALAVIAAVALNGYRESKSRAIAAPPTEAKPREAEDTTKTPLKTSTPEEARPARPARVDGGPRRGGARRSARAGAFVAGAWESAVAPDLPFGATVGIDLQWPRWGPWWPSFRAGAFATAEGSVMRDEGSAKFRLVAVRAGLCPLGWGDMGAPALRGCLELDAGRFDASGEGARVEDARGQSMPWLSAGPAARGEWPLASWFAIEVGAGVRALARHDRFVFRPETVVYDVPLLSAGVTLGVVGRLR